MGHGKGQEAALHSADDLREAVVQGAVDGHVEEVAMRQACALGKACGARRVDDRGEVVGCRRVDPPVDLGIEREGALCRDFLDGVLLDDVDRLEMVQLREQGCEDVVDLAGLRNRHSALRVFDDPSGLIGGVGFVYGNELRAHGPRRLIEKRELVA